FERTFGPEPVKRLRSSDAEALEREAESRLERVAEAFGDLSGLMTKGNYTGTMGEAARADLLEIRRLGVGRPAPEIAGEDVEGKPMTLGEYRGKVVVLNFGSHEFCGACRDLYPKERALVERMKGRPFALLGINSDDHRELVREVIARGEITWRSWWDGPGSQGGGPICRAWNINGYPTFYVLDHRGIIRSKSDVQPYQTSFDELLERLVKEAETERK
ncbi:TlpA family protein disulfide reductase, partial [Singulisphaera rosea]